MNLYVGNLSKLVTQADLEWIFEGLGHIIFLRLACDPYNDHARGYAFVAMDNRRQAEIAVSAMSGAYLKGTCLIVRISPLRVDRAGRIPRRWRARPPCLAGVSGPRLVRDGRAGD